MRFTFWGKKSNEMQKNTEKEGSRVEDKAERVGGCENERNKGFKVMHAAERVRDYEK